MPLPKIHHLSLRIHIVNLCIDEVEVWLLVFLGNDLMKVECYSYAVDKYTEAIDLDPRNAVYYSNRYFHNIHPFSFAYLYFYS